MLVGKIFEFIDVFLECGIVHENIQLSERSRSLFHGGPAECGVCHVAGQQNATAPFLFHRSLCFGRILMLVQVRDRYIGTLARK